MNADEVLYIGKSTVMMVFYLSMPTIGIATAVGLVIALIQTLIQLQEQTLAFAAKLAAVVAVFFMTGGWMTNELILFQEQILTRIAQP
ncbi:MAG: type III secretion system export apparatus subunit SctS [Rhodobacteraceae bacterium]|jgi:type III secretion protein S|nr:type III secretion system export apparatus subunit SctS [Paracoccaceae bacterium]